MCVPGHPAGPPASTGQALAVLQAALACLAQVDATALTAAEQADCLRGLQRAESARIAAQASVLDAFNANGGYADDGHSSARSWLRWQARITGNAASAAMGWARRLAAHPAIRDALAAGAISESWARQIGDWTDLLPAGVRADADAILIAAAAAGATLLDLAGLAEEMRSRSAAADRDRGEPQDRSLRLDLHYRGAGRLRGDLTPRCSAALQAVLDALGKKKGPEDSRTRTERDHDALEEACRRLIDAGLLPDRAGQPTKIHLHMTLDNLVNDPAGTWVSPGGPDGAGASPADLEAARRRLFPHIDDLTEPRPGRWTGPGPLATPGDLCDASIVPIVSGHVDHELLDKLVAGLSGRASTDGGTSAGDQPESARLGAGFARELILRNAVALLSGPSGLASRLRTGRLSGPAAAISLPLDCGTATDTIPPHLRRAVTIRDVHCGFPGCTERNCQVHHLVPVSEGGATRLTNLILCCAFHHLIAVHQWGWQLVLNADGTRTAFSPDGTRVLHSHDPPTVAA